MSINLDTYKFKQKIVDDINSSGLPLCLIDYVITEIANTVKSDYLATIQRENGAYDAMNQKNEVGNAHVCDSDGRDFEVIDGKKAVNE